MHVCVVTIVCTLMWSSHSYVQIEGELSFDVQILNDVDGRGPTAVNNTRSKDEVEADLREGAGDGRVTAGAILECEYQYPERQQLQALLSDMMNQLAQIFVRTQEFDQKGSKRWVKRFRVIRKQESGEFEGVFKNMTREYKEFYETTLNRLNRTGDPCLRQDELKQTWQSLLAESQNMLQRAAATSVQRVQRAIDTPSQRRLEETVARLVATARSHHLDQLCDRFQLCYDELLQK
ncbi:uncharacterized protein LOC116772774 [Danaus plexippus]|uniref:uncharacterized protein LOC116772774 n=1 Tax=Danaus plexippus TaxID=13037 RepID=UPI002AB0ADD6|nr:uncharacterized protein LOC116772774 [Danaus plexippus]